MDFDMICLYLDFIMVILGKSWNVILVLQDVQLIMVENKDPGSIIR